MQAACGRTDEILKEGEKKNASIKGDEGDGGGARVTGYSVA